MKFGGSSVQDARMIKAAGGIILERKKAGPIVVVLSALKGLTNELFLASQLAAKGRSTKALYAQMHSRHLGIWKELTKGAEFPEGIGKTFSELQELLYGVLLIRECTLRTRDLIMSFGERLSCQLMTDYLCFITQANTTAQYVDARDYILTDANFGSAHVNFSVSNRKLKALAKTAKSIPIVTGFIAATQDRITTTLGRNGSDYTAAILGAALNVERIEVWTDVDGVFSADPRVVPEAFVIKNISYNEAMELSFYGANVIHPQAIVPAVDKSVPILIKNTQNPKAEGTWIRNKSYKQSRVPITGLTSITYSSLLTIEGAGLSGNFYFLPKIFNVFALHHIQPLMIAQASSEHSICFVFEDKDIPHIKEKLMKEFKGELASKQIQKISIMKHTSIVSIIGSNMRGSIGLAGKVFVELGKEKINIIAIAQGSNEMNISVVVEREQEKKVLKLLHKIFFKKSR